jgi:hypothetical protein
LLAACCSIGAVPTVAQSKVGRIPPGGTVLSFAKQPTSVSVEGTAIAWSTKVACPAGLEHCYRGLVRISSKTVAVPGVLADADIDLGRGAKGNVVAAYERCSPAAACAVYSFDPAARAETQVPLAVAPGCRPRAPRISGSNVAYIAAGSGCSAPGLYVTDVSTGALAWKAWATTNDSEGANTDELAGGFLFWSTLLTGGSDSRTQPDRLYRGDLRDRTYAPIARGTTIADYSFESLSVSRGKLFYLERFSGDEQGASVSIDYQSIAGPKRSCRVKGLGTTFDPRVPRSLLLGVAAHGPHLFVALTREDTANRNHPSRLVRYRLSSLKRACSGR